MATTYYIVNKPFGMLTQFTGELGQTTLKDLPFTFPKDVYPVGRLDKDSEGLLLLTNDKSLNAQLLHPKKNTTKTYWAQVEGIIENQQIIQLQNGVDIKVEGKIHHTLPAKVSTLEEPTIWERNPPVRFRKTVPTSWLEISIVEGKNHQVRKMTAAVGLPTLRLIRVKIGNLTMGDLPNGAVKEIDKEMLFNLLF
ncbi:MAG: pseudouridine synthase [Chitinophagales bacterium]|nr:pseudouridine synthase [Chitinophagales bacterium]